MARPSGEEDPYLVLGVAFGATDDVIKRAYRRLALLLHPDKVRHHRRKERDSSVDSASEEKEDARAAEDFRRLQEAYTLLTDPEQRSVFDAKRRAEDLRKAKFEELDAGRKRLRERLQAKEAEAREIKRRRQDEMSTESHRHHHHHHHHGPSAVVNSQRASNRAALEAMQSRPDSSPRAGDVGAGFQRETPKSELEITDDFGTVLVAKWRAPGPTVAQSADDDNLRADLEDAFGRVGAVEFLVLTPSKPGRSHAKAMVGFATPADARAVHSSRILLASSGERVKTRWAPGHEPAADVKGSRAHLSGSNPRAAGPSHRSIDSAIESPYRSISMFELDEFAERVAARVAALGGSG